jgi:uncharacterized protein YdbL (DUF1318 family)
MKKIFILALGVIISLGCAKMQVGGTKEPIKVDISMRLDIYQHVEKDIDEIESIVSGSKEKNKALDKQSLLGYFISNAYAQEGLSQEVEQAALRRKDRYAELSSLQSKGVVGENGAGLLEIRNSSAANLSVRELVKLENNDRMIIYRSIAQKNNTSLKEIQKLYAKRLQNDAPTGTPIEILNQATGASEWTVKK